MSYSEYDISRQLSASADLGLEELLKCAKYTRNLLYLPDIYWPIWVA
jgi:hypothetical protein